VAVLSVHTPYQCLGGGIGFWQCILFFLDLFEVVLKAFLELIFKGDFTQETFPLTALAESSATIEGSESRVVSS
jgi:hypothetical protein